MSFKSAISESSPFFSAVYRLERGIFRLKGYQSRFIQTPVGPIHVFEKHTKGTLPPVLLLHGLNASASSFRPLLTGIENQFSRILIPDFPGHGFSALPAAGLTPDAVQVGLFEALNQMVQDRVLLIGNSLGGIAAMRFASQHPDKVRALLLISPGGAMAEANELRALLSQFYLDTFKDALRFVDNLHASPPWYRWLLALGMKGEFARPGIRHFLQTIGVKDLLTPDDLKQLSVPIDLIWGKQEKLFPQAHLAFFKQHLPAHARIIEPEEFSHVPYLDRAKQVAKYVLDFAHQHRM